ncbi:hypothetical protein [Anaerosporobacter sp.]|uniref:hypothetical protein n=1 Tax=Anaerosporobacter sp. TaxID=1872529 RepID=UPI00286EE39C|nr:hypothetical protein [Anaerosporobacter sp.]
MGKCKICGTEIADTEEMCSDCKALDDVDLIKSDEELEELLNSVMHSHTSYPNNDENSFISSEEMTIDPIREINNDSDEISVQLDSITSDLLEQYGIQDEVAPTMEAVSELDMPSDDTYEEEPFSLDSLVSEDENEEPFSLDSLVSEDENEEPFSLDSLIGEDENEEPFSLDSLISEDENEEPFSLDSLISEDENEEPFSLDSLISEDVSEEPFSLDLLVSEEESEEPFSLDALESEKEDSFSVDALMEQEESSEEPFALDSFMEEEEHNTDMDVAPASEVHSEEPVQESNDLYASIPGFEGIFDGIGEDEDEADNETSDVGDIFADVLGAVSNYGVDGEDGIDNEQEIPKPKQEKKDKRSIFKELFSNVENEETEKAFLKEKELEEARAAEKEAKKEQKAAAVAAKKASKEEAKKAKVAAKAAKKAEKAESETEEVVEEEQDHSKINKKGAAVVLIAFALLAVVIIVGTKNLSYSASIQQAEDYLARKKYSKAYKEISGIDVKKSDEELAKKIKTIMYVNKEIESYNNYYAIQYYAEALNSLLNGLVKYDVYLEQASELGVKSDLQYVKEQVLQELAEKYNLDEVSAQKIIAIEDQEAYSDEVFAIAEKLVTVKKR